MYKHAIKKLPPDLGPVLCCCREANRITVVGRAPRKKRLARSQLTHVAFVVFVRED